MPQRSNGRERVSAILAAAAQVIRERGFEAATMKEIADRADTKVGSLYRFFPSKEVLAEALMQRYGQLLDAEFEQIDIKAGSGTTAELADVLINFMAAIQPETEAMLDLLESRSDVSDKRRLFREKTLGCIVRTLELHAPGIDPTVAKDIAVVLLHNMRVLVAISFDPRVASSSGAPGELRDMNRLYLTNRLSSLAAGPADRTATPTRRRRTAQS